MTDVVSVGMAVVLDQAPGGTVGTCCACPFRSGPGGFREVFQEVTEHYTATHLDESDFGGRPARSR
jgi:hypothetical protein